MDILLEYLYTDLHELRENLKKAKQSRRMQNKGRYERRKAVNRRRDEIAFQSRKNNR